MDCGYVGASLAGSKSQAWNRSLKRETCISISSALSSLTTLQPVSNESPPSVRDWRRNSRRELCGISRSAALMSSLRLMACSSTADHRQNRARYCRCHDDVHEHESD